MKATHPSDRPRWVLDRSRTPFGPQQHSEWRDQMVVSELASSVAALFAGDPVNRSEEQPALHMALRAEAPDDWPAPAIEPGLARQRERFLDLAARLHSGSTGLTDLIHIGIGGSDLGPRLLIDALADPLSPLRVHCLSTLDYRSLRRLLEGLDPARTGLIVASKSFTTEETLLQARAVVAWLGENFHAQAWAATARTDRAVAFGFRADAVLAFPSWTGGRFSMWSSVGTCAAAAMGRQRFEELLAGAAAADADFRDASLQGRNDQLAHDLAALMHGLRRQLALPTLGIVAYDPRLALLGDYLQQLVMESLGKRVDQADRPVLQPTAPLIFSGRGTDAQHAMFQAFHQGNVDHPLLLVGTLEDPSSEPEWQRIQLAHLLGQAEAFAHGIRADRPCQELPGGRPVSLLMTDVLTPRGLGYLLASLEHAVFVLAVLWGVNPFDQWGVEEGKRLARAFKKKLELQPFRLEDLPRAGNFLKESE
jgi:glucose-6-phosphate isomerase